MKKRDDVAWLKKRYADGVKPSEQREVAEVETKVWAVALREMQQGKRERQRKQDFFRELGCSSGHAPIDRAALLSSGDTGEPIWEAIRKGKLTPTLGAELWRDARNLKKEQPSKSIDRCVDTVLKKKLKRRTGPGTMPLWSYKNLDRKPRSPNKPQSEEEKEFRSMVRELAGMYLRSELQGVDEPLLTQLTQEIEGEVGAVIAGFIKRVKARRDQQAGRLEAVSRYTLARACEQLGIPTPTKRNPFDYDLARRHYRRLAARHHPDVNSSPSAAQTYLAVNEAMEVIEQWRAQQN